MTLNLNESSKQVLRVDQDSETDLQALFDRVLKPDPNTPLQLPWRMRKLPVSFFHPPSTGSRSVNHSREDSLDSDFASSSEGSASGVGFTATQAAHLRNHLRAYSLPASLQESHTFDNQQMASGHHHKKHRSLDVGRRSSEYDRPLPRGWEQTRTPEGQIYYINHITRITTWEDPRKSYDAAPYRSTEPLETPSLSTTQNTTCACEVDTEVDLKILPDGWQEALTPEGETYFINHQTRTTSWFDPRISQHLQQRAGAVNMIEQSWQHTPSITRQQLRLQELQLERQRLKQRQQEIRLQQSLMLRGSNTKLHMDPLLSSVSGQESGDSDLGLKTAPPMLSTPENYLADLDDCMDVPREFIVSDTSNTSPLTDDIDSTDDVVPSLQLTAELSNVSYYASHNKA